MRLQQVIVPVISFNFPAAVIAGGMNDYDLMISPLLVLRETGLASIVPSVLGE